MTSPARKRKTIFLALCLVCAAGVTGYFCWIKQQLQPVAGAAPRHVSDVPLETAVPDAKIPDSPPEQPVIAPPSKPRGQEAAASRPARIFFRYTGVDSNYGKLAFVNDGALDDRHFTSSVACEVAHFAAGYGVCLTADRGMLTTYAARIFDAQFKTLFTIPVGGVPSRCRVSPDGRTGAFTFFVSGHSYASLDFSTQTLLVDTRDGRTLANLEDFAIEKNGHLYREADFNFWGVTFTPDSKTFYCTLSSNRKHYLVKGDIAARTGSVIHEGVECPSLSPDGLHIAFKKRFIAEGRLAWQLTILDVATLKESPLAENRSVDDQLEWFDNTHVLYSLPDNPTGASAVTNVWRVGIHGSAAPELILPKAYSPAVVRSKE